ncbi:MAG: ATP-grasp domain-containing protein [Streptococcaceae bacterium]|jgi:hypothetical protein|nr:ATP-grasp domain-containing protein [Streptococcaceae bacterium]
MKKVLLLDWSYSYRFYVKELLKEDCRDFYVVAPEYIADFEAITDYLIISELYESNYIEKNINEIISFVNKNKINSLFNTEDELVLLENRLKEKLGLKNCQSVVETLQNKHLVRKILEGNLKIKSPKFSCIEARSRDELVNKLKANISFPSIIKPLSSNFSSGVSLVESYKDIENAVEAVVLEVEDANSYDILVEDVISLNGQLISVETFVQNGKLKCVLFTDENQYLHIRNNGSKTFYYDNIFVQSTCSKVDREIMLEMVKEIIGVFKVSDLTLHIEFKLDNSGIWHLVEINPRLGGGPIAYSHYLSTGINPVLLSFKISNDITLELSDTTKKFNRNANIKFFNKGLKAGRINKISIDSSKAINYLDKIIFYFQEGEYYNYSPTGIGFSIVSGDYNEVQLYKISNTVKESIEVTFIE